MKKIILLSLLALAVYSSCRKMQDNPSITVTASFPLITFQQQYYSIPVGGVRPTVLATAIDTFYKQTCKIVTIDSNVNTLVPGLYTAQVSAQNKYGYVSYANYYVAVTSVSDALDLSGVYTNPLNDSITAVVYKLATGLFYISNYNGVNNVSNAAGITPGYFAVTNLTSANNMSFTTGVTGTLSLVAVAGDTALVYNTSVGAVDFAK